MDIDKLLIFAIEAALDAGKEIMQIYESDDFGVSFKDDDSPLTKADTAANKIICDILSRTSYPILSEEGQHLPYNERKHWETLWIVDPIDGTKEFIKKNGEFTVNIALVQNRLPVLGVIFIPAKSELYYATSTNGAFKAVGVDSNVSVAEIFVSAVKLPITEQPDSFTIVASRSHLSEEVERFIAQKEKEHEVVRIVSKGSSLKFCLLAEGSADCYPRFGPTMEWDTAAGQAICNAVGFQVIDQSTKENMKYNRENLLNGSFVVQK